MDVATIRTRIRDNNASKYFFTDQEITDAITDAYRAIYPSIYCIKYDTSLILEDIWVYSLASIADIDSNFGLISVEIEDMIYEDCYSKKTNWERIGNTLEFRTKPPYTGRRIRLAYAVPYAESSLPIKYEELILHYVLGRLQETRLHLRIQFEEYAPKSNVEAASAGDILGVSGYEMYQFQQLLEKWAMPTPSFSRHRRRG